MNPIVTLLLLAIWLVNTFTQYSTSTRDDEELFQKEIEKIDKAWAQSYWSIEQLAKGSDLIVVGEVAGALELSKTAEERDEFGKRHINALVVESSFRVHTVLKNDSNLNEPPQVVKLLHYSWPMPHYSFNAPRLIDFRRQNTGSRERASDTTENSDERHPTRYLLFLKESCDGRFEPTSTQYHPTLSVRKLVDN